MLTRSIRSCTLIIVFLLVAACGQKFESQSASCTSCAESAGSGLSSNERDAIWDQADIDGKVSDGQYSGLPTVQVDRSQNLVVLSIPVPGFITLPAVGSSFALNEIPGARVEVKSLSNQNSLSTAIAVMLPLATVLKGANLPALKLPLQTILPESTLPGLAVDSQTNQIPLTIYIGEGQVVLFVHFPFDPPVSFMSSIKNTTQTKTLGYLNALRDSDNGGDGGYFMLLKISPSVSRILDQLL